MGLFGGSKSTSSTSNTTAVNTETASADMAASVNNAPVISGANVINTNFDSTIGGAFNNLINLAGSALNATAESGDAALQNSQSALNAVANTQYSAAQPEYGMLKSLAPLIGLVAVAAIAAVVILRK